MHSSKSLSRTEINRLPAIAPLLREWQTLKAEHERMQCDGRYSFAKVELARAKADAAYGRYSAAVARIYAA
jgi:hypothetical protein